jgi:hypothetical protein
VGNELVATSAEARIMSKMIRYSLLAFTVLFILAGGTLFALYRATRQVPRFYTDELAIAPATQEKDSDHMLEQATTFYSDLQHSGRWRQTFEARTVNAWLAVDLPRNFPDSLPPGISDPRVRITPDGITLACSFNRFGLHGVISFEVSAFVESADVISLRIHKARLGSIPWSLDPILKAIANLARQSNARIQWRQIDGDPVALITLAAASSGRGCVVHIDSIKLSEGKLDVAGATEAAK